MSTNAGPSLWMKHLGKALRTRVRFPAPPQPTMGQRNRKMRSGDVQLVASTITGMVLAEAFVSTRANGCRLFVMRLDGVPHSPAWSGRDGPAVYAEVASGIVKRSWS